MEKGSPGGGVALKKSIQEGFPEVVIWGIGLGAVFASASELSQKEYDFTIRKDRVLSWMEMPQDPAVL